MDMRRAHSLAVVPLAALVTLLLAGCSTTPSGPGQGRALNADVQAAIQKALDTDPSLKTFFQDSAGYAVFPGVGAAAVGVGGAWGRGEVFRNGEMIGYTTLTQADIGLAFGGQKYIELIFFQTPEALRKFTGGQVTFAAQTSAVGITSGASSNASYSGGVAVFTLGEKGLMLQASIGGQKFSYVPA
jgi:hypothetical protein